MEAKVADIGASRLAPGWNHAFVNGDPSLGMSQHIVLKFFRTLTEKYVTKTLNFWMLAAVTALSMII